VIRNETYVAGAVVAATLVDLNAGTISFEQNGVVTSTRALTADEAARYAPSPPTEAERLAAAQAALAPLEQIAAPYTAADIVDVLLDVKIALGG
jgi:hypothetical protein